MERGAGPVEPADDRGVDVPHLVSSPYLGLWSLDLFRCDSAILRAHWVLVVMDQFTRRIVGFGVHRGVVNGVGLCRMFNGATRGHTPTVLMTSTSRMRKVRLPLMELVQPIMVRAEVCRMPYTPLSHPFVERLIGTIRRNAWIAPSSGRPPI
jgi:putative transposase